MIVVDLITPDNPSFEVVIDREYEQYPCSYQAIFTDNSSNNGGYEATILYSLVTTPTTTIASSNQQGETSANLCGIGDFNIRQTYKITQTVNCTTITLYEEYEDFSITLLAYVPEFSFDHSTCCYEAGTISTVPQIVALNNNVCGLLPAPNTGYLVGTGSGNYHENHYASFNNDHQRLSYTLEYYEQSLGMWVQLDEEIYPVLDGIVTNYAYQFQGDKLATYRLNATLTNCCTSVSDSLSITICDSITVKRKCEGVVECDDCNTYLIQNYTNDEVIMTIRHAVTNKVIHTLTLAPVTVIEHSFTEDGVYILTWTTDTVKSVVVNVMCQIDECYTGLLKMFLCNSDSSTCCSDEYLDSRLADVQAMYQTYQSLIEPYFDLNLRYSAADITQMLNDFRELDMIKQQILEFCVVCRRNCTGCYNWNSGSCL